MVCFSSQHHVSGCKHNVLKSLDDGRFGLRVILLAFGSVFHRSEESEELNSENLFVQLHHLRCKTVSRDHVVKKNRHISQHYLLITIKIDVSGGRTASYAAITKNVAIKDLNLIFKG